VSAIKYSLTLKASTNGNPFTLSNNTPTFCVGQQIIFAPQFAPALPSNVQIDAPKWVFSGTFVNTWTNANAYSSTNYFENTDLLLSQMATNWWVSGGYSPAANYNADFGETLTFPSGASGSVVANASINMFRPQTRVDTITGTVAVDGDWNIYVPVALHYGSPEDIPGISFSNTASITSGSIQWLQVVDYQFVSEQLNNGSWISKFGIISNALDNAVPYPHYTNDVNSTADSPGFGPKIPSNFETLSESNAFSMWLEFKPDGGIWVPLRVVDWDWNGNATKAGTNWVLTTNPNPDPNPSDSDTTIFPSWTKVAHNIEPH
jgi:hypothetical protein